MHCQQKHNKNPTYGLLLPATLRSLNSALFEWNAAGC